MSVRIAAERAGIRFLFDRERRTVTPSIARLRRGVTEVWGLRDVTFTASGGEAVALLGPSGAGKSTLLRAIAGVFRPDEGRLEAEGRVATLLSIDAGLMGMLTGRENATLIGALAGLDRQRTTAVGARVRDRNNLGDAFDRPVGTYSQGMRARLGFTIADETSPEILLLDEVHEALDHEFREVVERRAREILEHGGIVVAAGHDHPLLERISTRALLMRDGRVHEDGPFRAVQTAYLG